jgi:arylsulfatase A
MEVNWSVGEVLKALKKAGVEDKTWVIYTSDNGPWLCYGNHAGNAGPLREGKGTCWEGGTREPTVMRWPGKIRPGTTNDAMMMTIDLFPTVAKLIGAEPPKHKIDGLDVWPLIAGEKGAKNPHEAYAFYYAQNELQAVVSADGRWKLQLPHTYRTLGGKPGGRDGKPAKYESRTLEKAELYDLENDIREKTDVVDAHKDIVDRLQAFTEKMRGELGDALVKSKGTGNREPGRVR